MSVEAINIYTGIYNYLFYEDGRILGHVNSDDPELIYLIILKIKLLEVMLGYNKGDLVKQIDWLLMESL